MTEPSLEQRELMAYWQLLRRPLLGPEGEELLTFLERRYGERLALTLETTPGASFQRLERLSSHEPGDPYTTAFREGQRSVVLFLKDLHDLAEE